MKHWLALAILTLAVPLWAQDSESTPPPEASPAPKAASTPEEVDALFGQYWNEGNMDALVSLYEPEGALVGQDGSIATGHDAIRAALTAAGVGQVKITMNVVRVVPVGVDLAILANHWTITGTDENGNPFQMSGKAIEVVRKQADGSWLYACDTPFADQ